MQNRIQHTSKASNYFPKQEEVQFFAHVEFGAPSKNCQDYGICRLEIIKEPSAGTHLKHKYLGGSLVQLSDTKQVTISFPKSNLSEDAIQKYFGTTMFQVDENFRTTFQLPSYSEEKVLVISKGQYAIQENSKDYIVQFF